MAAEQRFVFSSADDQLSNQTVAIKKLVEPFKTNDVAKHMFREVKMLKHLQHDNVRSSFQMLLPRWAFLRAVELKLTPARS